MSRQYATHISRSEAAIVSETLAARQEEEGLPIGRGFTIVEDSASDVRVDMDEATLALLTKDASQDVYTDSDGNIVIDGVRYPLEVDLNA
jgi:hypothetical protein